MTARRSVPRYIWIPWLVIGVALVVLMIIRNREQPVFAWRFAWSSWSNAFDYTCTLPLLTLGAAASRWRMM